jgi:predicted CXXCH cytochrome family protein
MHTNPFPLAVAIVVVLAAPGPVQAADARLAPLVGEEAASTHGPYAAGACETCHERHDAKSPGAVRKDPDELCFGCHEEFKGGAPVKTDTAFHPDAKVGCTGCHNPHNARKKKLLL